MKILKNNTKVFLKLMQRYKFKFVQKRNNKDLFSKKINLTKYTIMYLLKYNCLQ